LELVHRVVTAPGWPGARRVAALVGRVGPEPLGVQQRRHLGPAGVALREAVQQHDRVAVERPLVADVEDQVVVAQPQRPGHPPCRRLYTCRLGPPAARATSTIASLRLVPAASRSATAARRLSSSVGTPAAGSAPATTIVTSPRTPSAAQAASSASGPRR